MYFCRKITRIISTFQTTLGMIAILKIIDGIFAEESCGKGSAETFW